VCCDSWGRKESDTTERLIWSNLILFSWLKISVNHSVVPNSLWPYGLYPARHLCPGILQARILEWVAIPFSRGSSWPRDRTWVFCIAGRLPFEPNLNSIHWLLGMTWEFILFYATISQYLVVMLLLLVLVCSNLDWWLTFNSRIIQKCFRMPLAWSISSLLASLFLPLHNRVKVPLSSSPLLFVYFSPCHPSKPRSILTSSTNLSCSNILWYVFLNASYLTSATHNLVRNYKAYCLLLSPALSCSLEPIIVSPGRLAVNNCLLNWIILFSNCFRFVHLTCLTSLKTWYAFVFPQSVKHRVGTQR